MPASSKSELEDKILMFLREQEIITLQEIAQRMKISAITPAYRRAIQRALANLIKKNVIEAQGQARARAYILKENLAKQVQPSLKPEDNKIFDEIPLSQKSIELLSYLLRPMKSRTLVRYNHDFLKSYQPNQTAYLSLAQRKELLDIGTAENMTRPAGTYARNILNRLLIDLSWNSSRLEGNTYSLLETKRLIELGENAPGKNITEAQMIINHKEAIEYIIESANEKTISSHEIRSIHALLSENLLGDASASGRLREISVGISGARYIPLDNPHVLKDYFNMFIKKLNLIKDPFEQSFFSLVQLSYMQAFEDVNKRTARLVSNIPLIKKNLKPLSFMDVNQKEYVTSLLGIYEKNDINLLRDLYIWAYKRSSQRYSALQQTMAQPNIFKLKYRKEIQDIIRVIILDKITGAQTVQTIHALIKNLRMTESESSQLFQIIESELMSLHDGNIARFKITPSEYKKWKKVQ